MSSNTRTSFFWPAAVWLEKKFWFWFAVFCGIVFFINLKILGAPPFKALILTALVLAVYTVIFFLYRALGLHRLYYWIAPYSPLKLVPKSMAVILIAFLVLIVFYIASIFVLKYLYEHSDTPKLPYSEFIEKAKKKQFGNKITLKQEMKLFMPTVVAEFRDLTDDKEKWTYFSQAPATIPPMSPQEWLHQNGYNVDEEVAFPLVYVMFQTLQGFSMSIPFFFFMWFIGGGGMRNMMQEWGTIKQATLQRRPPIWFKEIGGLENAIQRCEIFVRMLKNPRLYKNLTAEMPHGLLISGPPGAGKTMLATAVATEAGVPHFFITGAQFGQPLVGLGRETVNHFFELLYRNAPCVGVIDEFDSAVPVRGSGGALSGSERDAITNTVLSRIDEIQKKKLPILIIGITNLLANVDAAAKREGRFDRQIVVSYPGEKGREKIIKIHLATPELTPLGVPVLNQEQKEVFSEIPPGFIDELSLELAKITAGFSGAALANLVNEGKLEAAKKIEKGLRKGEFVARQDFYDALPAALTKSQQSDLILDEREFDLIAWHEGGHGYFSHACKYAEPTKYLFLEPHASVGGMAVQGGDTHIHSKSQRLAQIWVGLGGYVIEKAHFGEVSTGPSQDLRQVTAIARAMKFDHGMGTCGPIAVDVLKGETTNNFAVHVPGPVAEAAELEAQAELLNAEESMLKLLEDRGVDSHYAKIQRLAEALREKHMLSEKEIKEIIGDVEQVECEAVS